MKDTPSPDSWRLKLSWCTPWISWAAGMWIVFAPVFFTWFGVVPGGRGDPRLVNYTLEHGFRWLTRHPVHLSFWDPPIFFPYPNVSAFTDVLLGSGLLYWPWRLLGFQPDVSFMLWVLGICSANFVASYYLLRSCFSFAAAASSVGAYLYTFGGIRMANISHFQLLPPFWVVLAVIAALTIFHTHTSAARRRVFIAVLAAAAVLQAYTAFYTFFFFLLLLFLVLLIALAKNTTRAPLFEMIRRHAIMLALIMAFAFMVLLPLAHHYLEAFSVFGSYGLKLDNVPRPYSWFLMGPRNILYGSLQQPGGFFAHLKHPMQSNGLGVATLMASLTGLYFLRRQRAVVLLTLATAVLLAIAMSYGSFTPWQLVRAWVPGAGAIRALGRVSMVLLLPASIGLSAAVQRLGTRWLGIPAVVLAVICASEQVHRATWVDLEHERSQAQAIVERVPSDCTSFYLVCVGPDSCENSKDDAMWTQLLSDVPTVNGRYGHFPPDYELRTKVVRSSAEKQSLEAALERWSSLHNLAPDEICWIEYPGYTKPGGEERWPWPSRTVWNRISGSDVY
jgi:hypothetical protein